MRSILQSKKALWLLLALPIAWLIQGWWSGRLIYGELLHQSGDLGAWLVMLTLAITPFRRMFPTRRWPRWLLARRRYFGVAAFACSLLHLLVYVDRKRSLALILDEGSEFAMWTGWLAFAIFLALATTSNDASVRALGRLWKRLHRFVYAGAVLMFAHWIFSAFDFTAALVQFAILAALESYRVVKEYGPK